MAALRRRRAIWISCFPFVLKRFRRHLLAVPTGGNVLRIEAFALRLGAVAHPLSRQEGESECRLVAVPRFRFCSAKVCDQMPPASPRAAAAMEEATHTSRAALRPGTAVVVKISAGLDREAVSPWFRGDAWVCEFHGADYGMNTREVPPGGFGVAGFCVFQLWVQEGTAALAMATSTQTLLSGLF